MASVAWLVVVLLACSYLSAAPPQHPEVSADVVHPSTLPVEAHNCSQVPGLNGLASGVNTSAIAFSAQSALFIWVTMNAGASNGLKAIDYTGGTYHAVPTERFADLSTDAGDTFEYYATSVPATSGLVLTVNATVATSILACVVAISGVTGSAAIDSLDGESSNANTAHAMANATLNSTDIVIMGASWQGNLGTPETGATALDAGCWYSCGTSSYRGAIMAQEFPSSGYQKVLFDNDTTGAGWVAGAIAFQVPASPPPPYSSRCLTNYNWCYGDNVSSLVVPTGFFKGFLNFTLEYAHVTVYGLRQMTSTNPQWTNVSWAPALAVCPVYGCSTPIYPAANFYGLEDNQSYFFNATFSGSWCPMSDYITLGASNYMFFEVMNDTCLPLGGPPTGGGPPSGGMGGFLGSTVSGAPMWLLLLAVVIIAVGFIVLTVYLDRDTSKLEGRKRR